MSEVIDLCDSDEELPSLAARLAQKRGAPLPAGVQHEQPPAARAPLSALHNHAGGSPPAKADVRPPPPASRRESLGTAGQPGGAEELRRRQAERAARKAAREAEAAAAAGAGGGFDAPAAAAAAMPAAPHMAPRPQYHQQEQWQQQQQDGDLGAYLPPAGGSQQPRRPCRGAGTARRQSAGGLDAWQPPSQQQTQLLDDDDWRPSGAGLPGGSRPSSQQQMAGAAGAGGGGKPPPKKRRTKEQIEQDKALQVGRGLCHSHLPGMVQCVRVLQATHAVPVGERAAAARRSGMQRALGMQHRRQPAASTPLSCLRHPPPSLPQAREKADKQKQKQSGMAKYAMQEVRLLVDAALVSAGAAGASLGVSMLGEWGRDLLGLLCGALACCVHCTAACKWGST